MWQSAPGSGLLCSPHIPVTKELQAERPCVCGRSPYPPSCPGVGRACWLLIAGSLLSVLTTERWPSSPECPATRCPTMRAGARRSWLCRHAWSPLGGGWLCWAGDERCAQVGCWREAPGLVAVDPACCVARVATTMVSDSAAVLLHRAGVQHPALALPAPPSRFDLATEAWDCPRCCGGSAQQDAGAAAACSHAEAPVDLPARSVCAVAAHACGACAHANHIVCFGGEVDPSSELPGGPAETLHAPQQQACNAAALGRLLAAPPSPLECPEPALPHNRCMLSSHAALGHSGAGCFSNDLFCLDTTCQHWHRGAPAGKPPAPRGWLAATACAAGVVVHGGNGVDNQRLADMWLLEMH